MQRNRRKGNPFKGLPKFYTWCGEASLIVASEDAETAAMMLIHQAIARGAALGAAVYIGQQGIRGPADIVLPVTSVKSWLGVGDE